jgi:hypothetical protein
MSDMRHFLGIALFLAVISVLPASLLAQRATGGIDLYAQITPTAARPEPVRQFSFYVLTKSYADVVKEVEGQDILPTRDQFIDSLAVGPELKAWLKVHDIVDLTSPDLDKLLTVDDIMKVPEFFAAYQRSNSGGVTKGLPQPKYREADRTANPEKYKKDQDEFFAETRKFIETHRTTVQGIELELTAINPKTAWDNLHLQHKSKVSEVAPDTAQLKYLAGKAETDLEGHALLTGLAPGNYWVSTLGADAAAGDRRLIWDVPVTVRAGAPTRVDLSNINAIDTRRAAAP